MLSMKEGKGQLAKDFNAIITIIITEGPNNFIEADDVDDYDDDNDDDGERERGERPTGQKFYFRRSFIHHREQNIPAANFLPQYDPLVVAGDKLQGGFNCKFKGLRWTLTLSFHKSNLMENYDGYFHLDLQSVLSRADRSLIRIINVVILVITKFWHCSSLGSVFPSRPPHFSNRPPPTNPPAHPILTLSSSSS